MKTIMKILLIILANIIISSNVTSMSINGNELVVRSIETTDENILAEQEKTFLILVDAFMKYLTFIKESELSPQQKKKYIQELYELKDEMIRFIEINPGLYNVNFQEVIDNNSDNSNENDVKDSYFKRPFKWGRK
jgi:hypothetical protein